MARSAQQCDDALRLAERIGADQVRALRKQPNRIQQLPHFMRGVRMPEHRQAERGFGDEDIARHHLEWCAGWVRRVLVVAGGDDTQAVAGHRDLRRPQHMTGRVKADADVVELKSFAVADSLRAAGEIVAIAQPHHVERFLRRQHRAVAGAGVIGVGVGDQGALHRPHRIDVKIAEPATKAGCCWGEKLLRTHDAYIGRIACSDTVRAIRLCW